MNLDNVTLMIPPYCVCYVSQGSRRVHGDLWHSMTKGIYIISEGAGAGEGFFYAYFITCRVVWPFLTYNDFHV